MTIDVCLSIALTLAQIPTDERPEPVLEKVTFHSLQTIGDICDVAVRDGGAEGKTNLVVLGTHGFTTCQVDRLPAVQCNEPTAFASALNGRIVEDEGRFWFLRGHEHWAPAAELYDESGQLVWRVPPDPQSPDWKDARGVEFAIPLRTSGGLAFAIGFNATDTIAMVLPGSREPVRYRWKRSGSRACAWDIDGDGADEIVYPTGEGVVVRRVDGAIITTIAPTRPGYLNEVFPTRDPGGDGDMAICVGYYDKKADRQRYEIFSPGGELLGSLNDPASHLPATELGKSGYYFRTEEIVDQRNQFVGFETSRLHLLVYRDREPISATWMFPGAEGAARDSGGSAHFEQDGKWIIVIGYGPRLFVYRVSLPRQPDP